LSGTPLEEMTINFTSQVVDVVGSSDSKPFSFQIEAAWICADIDGNREGPDIADMIYLVNFMFNDGPPLPAPEAANFDGDIDITITDLITLTDYMFNNGPMPTCN
ncbi:MAG: hypothetical protein U9R56_05720, partial [candidate division Zixibacteria bacterium]|nr:hypothetical protein [candidate division Zixibacteria bacterium]